MFTYKWYADFIHTGMEEGVTFFLRHDIDISLAKAVEMAEFESKNNFHSTYYVLMSSPFYNTFDPENLERIRMIRQLGMGVGLHYDLSIMDSSLKSTSSEIAVQIGLLEYHVGKLDGLSVTFHRPLRGKAPDEELVELLNENQIYVPDFDSRFKYISDSGHNWREDPFQAIKDFDFVHINTHPEWYNTKEKSMEDCLYGLKLEQQMDKLVTKQVNSMHEYLERVKKKKK